MKSITLPSLLLGIVLLAGCGSGHPATYPVQGKVTFPDGSPLKDGTVEFRSKTPELKNLNAQGTITDGSFTVGTFVPNDGAVEGEHEVVVIPNLVIETRPNVARPPDPIDAKYRDYGTSGLKATVKAQKDNKVDLQVTAPAGS